MITSGSVPGRRPYTWKWDAETKTWELRSASGRIVEKLAYRVDIPDEDGVD
jgi:hypothetical protein